jgi:beta-mannosidase
VDVSWAYRFGPPAQDLIAVSLETPDGELVSQAFRFPAGRPLVVEAAGDLGLEAVSERTAEGVVVRVRSRRFAYGVRVAVDGWVASDDGFGVEPGHERRIALRPGPGISAGVAPVVTVRAINLRGSLTVSGPRPT